jgi:hypothetical protein
LESSPGAVEIADTDSETRCACGFSILLRQQGVDLRTAQELLRHANSRITLEICQESVAEEQRDGNASRSSTC